MQVCSNKLALYIIFNPVYKIDLTKVGSGELHKLFSYEPNELINQELRVNIKQKKQELTKFTNTIINYPFKGLRKQFP